MATTMINSTTPTEINATSKSQHHQRVSITTTKKKMMKKKQFLFLFFTIGSFLFLVIQLRGGGAESRPTMSNHPKDVSSSMVPSSNNKDQSQQLETEQRRRRKGRQRICILAGPHKTGSSSLQWNMYQWTHSPFMNTTTTTTHQHGPSSSQSAITNWIFPIQQTIVKIENQNKTVGSKKMSLPKVYYPMMMALRKVTAGHGDLYHTARNVFQQYTSNEVLDLYHMELMKYWELGYNLVFGTEAMDSFCQI